MGSITDERQLSDLATVASKHVSEVHEIVHSSHLSGVSSLDECSLETITCSESSTAKGSVDEEKYEVDLIPTTQSLDQYKFSISSHFYIGQRLYMTDCVGMTAWNAYIELSSQNQASSQDMYPNDAESMAAGDSGINSVNTDDHFETRNDIEYNFFDLDLELIENKRRCIEAALDATPPDRERLCELALSNGGLLSDELRRRVWPVLLDVEVQLDERPCGDLLGEDELRCHWQYGQVILDVERTLKRFPPGIHESVRSGMQADLVRLIMTVLIRCPDLHYYQGYHDVAITVLLVCGQPLCLPVMEAISQRLLGTLMADTMEPTCDLLSFMTAVIERQRPDVASFIEQSGVGVNFAVPWLLTWFSHVLSHYCLIVRVFDFVLASGRLSPVYLCSALVLSHSEQLVRVECELAAVHQLMARLPAAVDDSKSAGGWQTILQEATRLMHELPSHLLTDRVEMINRQRRQQQELLRLQMHEQRRRRRSSSWLPTSSPAWKIVGGAAMAVGTAVALQVWYNYHQHTPA